MSIKQYLFMEKPHSILPVVFSVPGEAQIDGERLLSRILLLSPPGQMRHATHSLAPKGRRRGVRTVQVRVSSEAEVGGLNFAGFSPALEAERFTFSFK
jgi:hypothetical protein